MRTVQYALCEGGGAASSMHEALIGCFDPGAVDSFKSNYSHWVEPQTVDFYMADLFLILLSDHNHNFSKYNKKAIDYNLKPMGSNT